MTLEEHGDRANGAHAGYLAIRRLVLIGQLDEAERTLAKLDPAPLPPALRSVHELVVAGIAATPADEDRPSARHDPGAPRRR